MNAIREGHLEFTFGGRWNILKYDENGSFYKTLMEKKVKPTKAVDFLCLLDSQQLLILEAKDFSLAVPKREKFDAIPNVVAIKARDTIAGIIGGAHRADHLERPFFQSARSCLSKEPLVMYFFEDLSTPARRPPQRSANKRDVLQKLLQEHLRWLTRSVVVVGLNDYDRFIPELTIRRL